MNNYFEVAIKEAKKAMKNDEVPIGAVIVKNNKIIAKTHNNRQSKNSIIGHAEINCIIKAEKKLKDWRLNECEMYVTLEPCDICKIFIEKSRIKSVYYLTKQNNLSNRTKNTVFLQTNDCKNLKKEAEDLIKNFFLNLRNKI